MGGGVCVTESRGEWGRGEGDWGVVPWNESFSAYVVVHVPTFVE